MLIKRNSGILLHITSLPSRFGIGDFGPEAYRFADFLQKAGQHVWQILPLNMPTPGGGNSPYNCYSAFAGNPNLISPEQLYRDGYIQKKTLGSLPSFPADRVDFRKVSRLKSRCIQEAWPRFNQAEKPEEYDRFLAEHRHWLDDFALYMALKAKYRDKVWSQWPPRVRNRDGRTLNKLAGELEEQVDFEKFRQFLILKQYFQLKQYCNDRQIHLFGDLPIYVTYDSADVWSHPELFKLDRRRRPECVAGVPPDYFSATGQLWGNPVYDWQQSARTGHRWWMDRMMHNLNLYDLVRIDHFRGFEAYWEVPARETTAINGRWVAGPGEAFFKTLLSYHPQPPIIVEDLGYITAGVRELIRAFHFPVMKVLQFGFDGDLESNPHVPFNHESNSVVYTGTHDNNTTIGWYRHEAAGQVKKNLRDYLGRNVNLKTVHWEMIRLALGSSACLAVIPLQDLMGLDSSARMNNPATAKDNWRWRLANRPAYPQLARKLTRLCEIYGRL